MNTAQIVGSLMLLGALAAAWSRYSIAPAGVARLEELYLWLVPASVGLLAMLHDFAGIRVLLAVAGVHVALIVFALAMVTRRAAPGTAPQALAAAGLITGSAVVWIAATTFPGMSLQAIAAERTGHLVTTGGFVLGTLLTLAAFVFIDELLWETRGRLLARLGLLAFAIGTVFWLAHLGFRGTVMMFLSQDPAAVASPLDWYASLRLWAGSMYVVYMALAYLSIAAFGAALLQARMIGKGWGRAFIAFGVGAAALFLAGVQGFNMPLMVHFMPFAMGMLLLRRLMRREPQPVHTAAAGAQHAHCGQKAPYFLSAQHHR